MDKRVVSDVVKQAGFYAACAREFNRPELWPVPALKKFLAEGKLDLNKREVNFLKKRGITEEMLFSSDSPKKVGNHQFEFASPKTLGMSKRVIEAVDGTLTLHSSVERDSMPIPEYTSHLHLHIGAGGRFVAHQSHGKRGQKKAHHREERLFALSLNN